ncbi:MAG: sulfotransferase [Pseudomonadota bacterium]
MLLLITVSSVMADNVGLVSAFGLKVVLCSIADRHDADIISQMSKPNRSNLRHSSALVSRVLVSSVDDHAPLIVVGLPRSGSSLLSDIISQTDGWYIFDDLYLTEYVDENGLHNPLTQQQLSNMLEFLGWQIRARMRHKPFAIPKMGEDEIEPMNEAIQAAFSGQQPRWWNVQREWLMRLSIVNGCRGWGYNHPGSFLSVDALWKIYPDARFLFLFRNPQNVLASFKHLADGHNDGNSLQYHPLFYSLYWRKSVQAYQQAKAKRPGSVAFVRFEDIIASPVAVITSINEAFSFDAKGKVSLPPANSSFSGKRKGINGIENNLLRRLAHKEISALGYEFPHVPVRSNDYVDLMITTVKFAIYSIRHRLTNAAKLKKLFRMLTNGN